MSDEDTNGDEYIRHPPSYRSKKCNEFIEKLEKRLSKKGCPKPRLARIVGSPDKSVPPPNSKKWTIERDPAATHESGENMPIDQPIATTSSENKEPELVVESDSEFSIDEDLD